ncbi:MAG: hypothetical protein AB8H80_19790 [Planctomycetota bacterium]
MKTSLAAVLLLLPLTLPGLTAQNPAAAASAQAAPARKAASRQPVTVNLKFDGGSLAEYVAAIRAQQPKANIVLAVGARTAVVPSLELREAGIEQALEAACMAVEADFRVTVREFKGPGQPVYSIVAEQRRVRKTAAAPKPAGPARTAMDYRLQRVFSLNEITQERPNGLPGVSVETVLSAIELAMLGVGDPPKVRFHKDSGLLLLRGSLDHAELVQQMLATMMLDQRQREQRKDDLDQRRAFEESKKKDR